MSTFLRPAICRLTLFPFSVRFVSLLSVIQRNFQYLFSFLLISQTVYFSILPTIKDTYVEFEYSPFSPGIYYLYVSLPEGNTSIPDHNKDSKLDLNDYIIVDVDTSSFRVDSDNDFNMGCASRKYCMSTSRVLIFTFH